MSNTVSLVGVGAMGKALLKRLRLANKDVRAYDVFPAAAEAAKAGGAVAVNSPAEAAQGASFVHIMVASDEETLETTLGEQGALKQAAPDTIILLHATIMPVTTQRIAAEAAKKNVRVLDAPITAIPSVFESGNAVFLVGGPRETVDAARDYLLQIGKTVHHFGPLGAGNVAKLAKSLINVGERILLSEVLNFAEKGGLDLRQFLEMQLATRPGSALSEWEDNFRIENGHARHRPATNLFNKDIVLAAKMADIYELDAPITLGAAQTSKKWVASWQKR